MDVALKILLLDDSAADAEMVRYLLQKEMPGFEHCLAMDREEFIQALDNFQPHLILSDNSLPQFSATEALEIVQQRALDIPFILVTGSVSDEFAARIIKLGADDYVLKDRLKRLPSAIENAFKQKKAEQEKAEAMQQLIRSEQNLRIIFENSSEGFILTDREGIIRTFNNNAHQFARFYADEMLVAGRSVFHYIEPSRTGFVQAVLSRVLTGETMQFDRCFAKETAELYWLNFYITPVRVDGSIDGVCITSRDITERRQAEDLQHALEEQMQEQKIQEQKKITRAMIRAQEQERNHIGQELHDNINQILAGTKMFLHSAVKHDPKLEALVAYPMELLDRCVNEIRLLSQRQVTPLKDIDLKEQVQSLLEHLQNHSEIKAELKYNVLQLNDDDLKLNIYRILQEQINNIVKYAAAKHVSVSIQGDAASITITVTDDGKGFDVTARRKGVGISNMRNRIESFNGEMRIASAPGKGCTLELQIPMNQPAIHPA